MYTNFSRFLFLKIVVFLMFLSYSFTSHAINPIVKMPPSATISGSAEVCLNESEPEVTFTGTGGPAPFIFTYTINGGPSLSINSNNSGTAVLDAPTNATGTFVYNLISVEDNNGNTATANGMVTIVVSKPQVSFSFTNNQCSGTSVNFTSTVTGNGPYTYTWNFGDGSSSTNANPNHIFEALGCGGSQNFNVTLTVTDVYGCTTTESQMINVLRKPEISFIDIDSQFNPFDNCGSSSSNPSYTINVGNTSPSTSCITSYNVNWGDGNTETNVTFPASHTYQNLGSFNMTITAVGDSGCNNSVTYLVKNSSNPIGAIISPGSTINLCIPISPLNFAIGSWGTNPPDTIYFVDYGDGETETYTQADLESSSYYNSVDPASSSNFPIPHVYSESNCPDSTYTVNVIISTSCGDTNLSAGPIIILKKPDVNFDVDEVACVNTNIQFVNTSTVGYNVNCNTDANFYWDFGDGATSTLENPTHSYSLPGVYTVSLYAENYCGETSPITKDICIEPPLQP